MAVPRPISEAYPDGKPFLHIYAQADWHGDAYIAGTRGALERLAKAIAQALAKGDGEAKTFVNDGEGYDAQVVLVDAQQAAKLAVPYVDDIAREHDEKALHPWTILRERHAGGVAEAGA